MSGVAYDFLCHELRTPLTVLLGNSATLQLRGEELSPELRQSLCEAMAKNAVRLQHTIETLLQAVRTGA